MSEKEKIQNLFRGYMRCKECMMFHVFVEELKRIGDLPKDHAWSITPHLTKEQKQDALSFNVYEANGFWYFGDEKAMVEYARHNGLLK
jgi:uncharacterized protein YneR